MSTTIPMEFVGKPTVTPEKIAALKDWYVDMLGDMDKASDVVDSSYCWGYTDAMSDALIVLHDNATEAIKVIVKPGRRILTKKNIIIGVTAFVLYKNRIKVKSAYSWAHHEAYEFVTNVSAEIGKQQTNHKTV